MTIIAGNPTNFREDSDYYEDSAGKKSGLIRRFFDFCGFSDSSNNFKGLLQINKVSKEETIYFFGGVNICHIFNSELNFGKTNKCSDDCVIQQITKLKTNS